MEANRKLIKDSSGKIHISTLNFKPNEISTLCGANKGTWGSLVRVSSWMKIPSNSFCKECVEAYNKQ